MVQTAPFVALLSERIEPVAIRFQLDLVVLFGSAARGRLRPGSDIDLGLVTKLPLMEDPQMYEDFMAALEPLENEFGRNIDTVQINSRNLVLLKRILMEGILLYESQPRFYRKQRLHWRFLIEDNIRYTLNYLKIIQRRLEAF